MTKDHFLLVSYGTEWPLCVDVPLNTYSFITCERHPLLEQPHILHGGTFDEWKQVDMKPAGQPDQAGCGE